MCSSTTKQAMEQVWDRSPNSFQSETIPPMLQTMAGVLVFEGLLLAQPTGSGKSSVPQTVSVVTSGATIVIEPALSLSSDQSSKFDQATSAPGGLVHSCQLDLQKKNNKKCN